MKYWILSVMFILPSIVGAELADTQLLPEVKNILIIEQVNPKTAEDNAFLWLEGLDIPIEVDPIKLTVKYDPIKLTTEYMTLWLQVYQKAINRGNGRFYIHELNEHLKTFFAKIKIDPLYTGYRFPCFPVTDKDCITLIMKEYTLVNFFLKNRIVLDRYDHAIGLPYYNTYGYLATNHYNLYGISSLSLAEAVSYIETSRVDKGLKQLEKNLNFYKKILVSDNLSSYDYGEAADNLYSIYQIAASLIDNDKMYTSHNKPILLRLLKPFSTDEQQVISRVLTSDRNNHIRLWQMNEHTMKICAANPEIGRLEEHSIVLTQWDKAKILNSLYQQAQPYIEGAKLTLPESADYYLNTIKKRTEPSRLANDELYNKYFPIQEGGQALVEAYLKDTEQWPLLETDFYDLVNYLHLIQLKLIIKEQGVTADTISDFLKQAGDKAINPYNKQPYVWDAEKQTLSSELLNNKAKTKYHVIHIKF